MKIVLNTLLILVIISCAVCTGTRMTTKMQTKNKMKIKATMKMLAKSKIQMKVKTSMKAKSQSRQKSSVKQRSLLKQKQSLKQRSSSKVHQQLKSKSLDLSTMERLKALSKTDKIGAMELMASLKSQLKSSEKEADPAEEPITGKLDPGLFSVIPQTFNVSSDSQAVVMVVQDIPAKSLINRHDLDYEEYCNVKQGYLGMVISNEKSDKLDKQVLTIKPMFAVLNKLTLTLFENENVKNMYRSFSTKYTKPDNVPEKWKGTHCWQVIRGDLKTSKDKMKEDTKEDNQDPANVIVSVCASDDWERDKWMQSIRDFHDCEVKEGPSAAPGPAGSMKAEMDNDIIIEKEREAKDQEEIQILGDSLDAVDDIVAENVNKMKVEKKKKKQALEEEEEKIEELEDKEKCLSQNLFNEAKKKELEAEKGIGQQFSNNMKISTKKLDDINKDRMNRIIQEEDSQMFLRKKLENNLKDEMMEQTKSFSKNYNSMDCYSEQTFKDGSEGIKRVCGSLYQPSANQDVKQLILCLEKDSFCGQCCRGFLGVELFQERDECKAQCTTTLNNYRGDVKMTVVTDNGVTEHKFLYGAEEDEREKLKKASLKE